MIQLTYEHNIRELSMNRGYGCGIRYWYGKENGNGRGSGYAPNSFNKKGNGQGVDMLLTIDDKLGNPSGDGECVGL
jgi:hypothetical protein